MASELRPVKILMADHHDQDCLLLKSLFEEISLSNECHFFDSGLDLMDCLYHRGRFTETNGHIKPGLIFLDLNMPKLDGLAALRAIKSHEEYRKIPVVILSKCNAQQTTFQSFMEGADAFLLKPLTAKAILELIRNLKGLSLTLVNRVATD